MPRWHPAISEGFCRSYEGKASLLRPGCMQVARAVRTPDGRFMRIALGLLVLGLLFLMSDCIQPAVQQVEIDAAVAAPAPVERVRRLERSAAAAQPPVEESHKRHPNQRWQAHALVERPAGGKNTARKLEKLGPFRGSTKEIAEAARNVAIDNFLHEPEKKRKKEPAGSSSAAPTQEGQPAPARPKRDAAPSAPGALKMPTLNPGPQPGQRGAGPGYASPDSRRCANSPCWEAHAPFSRAKTHAHDPTTVARALHSGAATSRRPAMPTVRVRASALRA